MKFEIKPILLLLAVISASLFMVVESGEYYSTFYKNPFQGYWAALLVEGFLAIAAMLHLSGRKKLNFCIKAVMAPLFIVVVTGASLKIVAPMMTTLASIKNDQRLVEHLEEQNQQVKTHLALLKGQKVNTALAIKHQRQISTQLTNELQKKSSSTWMIWIVILFSTFLRLSVQLVNLVFAYSLGEIWKKRNKPIPTQKKSVSTQPGNSNLQIKRQKICQYIQKNGGSVSRGQLLASRVLKGGVKEYDRILTNLENEEKIRVDTSSVVKQEWRYKAA